MKTQILELADALKVRIQDVEEKFSTISPAQVEIAKVTLTMVIEELEYLAEQMITDPVADVRAFHEKFDIGYSGPPRILDPQLAQFRTDRFLDEAREYREAHVNGARDGMLDAIVDSHYIALGTCLLQGWDFLEAWRRVHAANMRKELASRANPGKFGHAQDVVKPAGWEAANLQDLV